jgi:hypothetical protein
LNHQITESLKIKYNNKNTNIWITSLQSDRLSRAQIE